VSHEQGATQERSGSRTETCLRLEADREDLEGTACHNGGAGVSEPPFFLRQSRQRRLALEQEEAGGAGDENWSSIARTPMHIAFQNSARPSNEGVMRLIRWSHVAGS